MNDKKFDERMKISLVLGEVQRAMKKEDISNEDMEIVIESVKTMRKRATEQNYVEEYPDDGFFTVMIEKETDKIKTEAQYKKQMDDLVKAGAVILYESTLTDGRRLVIIDNKECNYEELHTFRPAV